MLMRFAAFLFCLICSPAFAGFHGGGASPIVVTGNSQLDTNFTDMTRLQVFINAFKGGANPWTCVSGTIDPSQIQTNGMPASGAACMSTGGILHTSPIPLDTEQTKCGGGRCNWAWIWIGNCSVGINNVAVTTEGGTNPGNGSSFGSSPWIFQVPVGTTALDATIVKTDGTCGAPVLIMVGQCTALALNNNCGDYDTYAAGGLFEAAYYKPILDGKFSKFRPIGWETTTSIVTYISSHTYDKPYNYPYWYAGELRPSIWIPSSEMTYSNVTNEVWTGTCTGGCTVETGSNGPQDRDTVMVQWNQTASSGTNDWYFSLNGTTPIQIADSSCVVTNGQKPTSGQTAILVYEKQLNLWCDFTNTGSLFNGVPLQALFQFCNVIKSHCVITEPMLVIDPDNGWITAEAQLGHATLLPGLNNEIENSDEAWNFAYPAFQYFQSKSLLNWGASDFRQEQCIGVSQTAQDLQRVYGTAPGHGWLVLDGAQTASGPPSINPYLNCSDWVSAGTPVPVQPGVVVEKAADFSPAIMVNSYMEPGEVGLAKEIIDAYNYVTSNQATAAPIANNYMATLASDNNAGVDQTTLPVLLGIWQIYQTDIAAANTLYSGPVTYNGSSWTSLTTLTQYEGGIQLGVDSGCTSGQASGSACFTSLSNFGAPAISNITAASSGVLTLASTDNEGNSFTAVSGMPVTIFGASAAGFNQSCGVTGVSGATITTNCNTVGLTYSTATVATTAKPAKNQSTVAVASCSGITAGLSVLDETQTDIGGVVKSCTGTTLTLEQVWQHSGSTTTDTLLIGGGLMQYGTDTSGDGFSSASITSAAATNPCGFTLSSPMNVFPPNNINTSGVTPSGYNFNTGGPPTGASVFSVDSTGENITLAKDCTGTGGAGSGGTMSVTLDQAVDALRFASRYSTQAQTVFTTAINEFAGVGGTGMAMLFYACCGYVNSTYPLGFEPWGAFWPDPTFTPSPMWNAYVAANGGTYP